MIQRFSLNEDQVPEPCQSAMWVDLLRWMICVMDPTDARIGFISGCLSYAVANGGLTEKQSEAANAILQRVLQDWVNGVLVCQNTPALQDGTQSAAAPLMIRKH